MVRALLAWLLSFSSLGSANSGYFMPSHRLTALGAARNDMTPELLKERARLMVESQTFIILRDPRAKLGAQRVEALRKLFEAASKSSGFPADTLEAIAFLESFGDPNAQSPAGPRGIMQVSSATARDMGLRLIYATKYRVTTERRAIKGKRGKVTYKNLKVKTPYQVLLRDERLVPERAIPAAAHYLARLEQSFGGRDWAIFAYHCGVGCVSQMQALTAESKGIGKPITVPKMYFGASPVLNKELYAAVKSQMERDWSPTYYFRVSRAEQLLALYREDPATFDELVNYYRNEPDPTLRASHRLAVWLKSADLEYQSCADIRREDGKKLARIFNDPGYFGFVANRDTIGAFDLANRDYYLNATPAAIGTLTYIAFETRRLFDAMKPHGEKFVPLEVTSLVRSMDTLGLYGGSGGTGPSEASSHCSGQVFDIRFDSLPPGEKEALRFVLDDMGDEGYLGFIEESPKSGIMHIGCSPSSRTFFTQIYEESIAARRESSTN